MGSRYYARTSDGEILELNENGTYSFTESKKRGHAHEYSPEIIEDNPNFEVITEEDFPRMAKRSEQYYSYISWSTRSDGHGGCKGGSFEEWLKLNNQEKV